MANWYVSSASWSAVTPWAASSAVSVGALRRQLATPTVGNERVWRCTTAGTTGASEPSWTLTKGSTTSDNGVVWTECTGQEAYQGPVAGAWTAPFARLETAYNSGWSAATDTVFVSNAHSQTQASAWSPAITQNTICVTETTVPPTSANQTTGAVIETSGNNGQAPTCRAFFVKPYIYGIKFRAAAGAGAATSASRLYCAQNAHDTSVYEKCDFEHASTNGVTDAIMWSGDNTNEAEFINCTVKFGHAGSNVNLGSVKIRGNVTTFLQGAVVPTTLANLASSNSIYCDGLDLSNVSGNVVDGPTNYGGGETRFRNCKMHASATFCTGQLQGRGSLVEFLNCDAAGAIRHERYTVWGSVVVSTSVVAQSSEAGTAVSWRVTTNSAANYNTQFVHSTFPLSINNTVVGSAVNVTVEGVADPRYFSALPNNGEIWFDCGYNSDIGGSGLQTIVDGSKGGILATASALAASTRAWDSAATSRANSTAYSVGDIRKVASNPGRLFICTTAGTSAGSEPGGYSSAVDGGTVTDGTATFKAMWRFKQTITVTPRVTGYIYAYPKMAKASAVVYIDPLITLS